MTRKRELSTEEFRAYIAAECEKAGGQVHYALKLDVSQSSLSAFLNGRIDPPPRIYEAAGFRRVHRFIKDDDYFARVGERTRARKK